ncbi:MAG: lysostaphin resistance A-like protein [Candidatus Coproplasma sp.]
MENKNTLPLSAKGGGLAYSLTVVFYLLIALVISCVVLTARLIGTDAERYLNYLGSPIAIAVIAVLYFVRFKQPVKKVLPIKTSPKYYLLGVMLIFGLLFSLNSLNELLVDLLELIGYKKQEFNLPDISGWKILPAIVIIAIIPAIMEEILFRGIILNNAEDSVGTLNAIFIVGLLFSLYHGSVEQTVYQFICGCLFAFLAVRSRSVAPCILIHFLNNAVILILYALGLIDKTTGYLVLPLGWEIGLTIASALCLIGSVVWLILDKKEIKKAQTGGVKSFFVFASVGIAVMVVMWIVGLF